jgi:hypothetical protein
MSVPVGVIELFRGQKETRCQFDSGLTNLSGPEAGGSKSGLEA